MSRRHAFLMAMSATAVVTLVFTASKCRAQLVKISPDGGVHVRAPFVRVHVDPYGGTSVRAPFTAVDVPGRGFEYARPPAIVEHHVSQPSLPSAQELADMDDEAFWQYLRSTADRLHLRLARFNTGASWQRYLRLPEDMQWNSSTDSHKLGAALTELLRRFRYVGSEPRYDMIANLRPFTAMQAALAEAMSRLESSPAGGAQSEELPMPAPKRSSRGSSFLKSDPGRE